MMIVSKKVVLLISTLIILGVLFLAHNSPAQKQEPDKPSTKSACRDFNQAILLVNDSPLSVALATTNAERSRGLAGCADLPEGQGMYFVFDKPKPAVFWMKGMLIPLDIIWISDNTVVGLEKNVPPPANPAQTDPLQYHAPQPVDAVLELFSGQAKELNIDVGTVAVLSEIDKAK